MWSFPLRAPERPRPFVPAWGVLAALALAGCASPPPGSDLAGTAALTERHWQATPRRLDTEAARVRAVAEADRRLSSPLGADDAVVLALAHSPAYQQLLADSAARLAQVDAGARVPNPVLTFERLVKHQDGARLLDIGRMLSVSLLDLLRWPGLRESAARDREAVLLAQTRDTIATVADTRQRWVEAVAARQRLAYAEQVLDAAQASGELARRMQAQGHFSRLQAAREEAFEAEALLQWHAAQHEAAARREALVRRLGLSPAQADRLSLPDRLPDLPRKDIDEVQLTQQALDERVDVQLARLQLERAGASAGFTRLDTVVNGLHLGLKRNSATGEPTARGFELELPLPVFDPGDARRSEAAERVNAATHAAAQTGVDAASQMREATHGWRTARERALHLRQTLVPLRRSISEEVLAQYNGMLVGVFELLSDAREQVGTVRAALDAERDFWRADAVLEATSLGVPMATPLPSAADPAETPSRAGGH